MNKRAGYIIRIVGVLLILVGGAGFMAGFVLQRANRFGYHPSSLNSFELPLGDLEGIAVDSEGNIYCGAQFYSRIQVYDAEGKFLYGRFIDSNGGAFRIRINEDDRLEVATLRNHKLYLFDKNGNLVHEWSGVGHHYFHDFGRAGETRYYDERENVNYLRRGSLFYAYIVKRDSSGQERVIVRTPLHKWLFQGPLPAWMFGVIGVIVLNCDGKRTRKPQERNKRKLESNWRRIGRKIGRQLGRKRTI